MVIKNGTQWNEKSKERIKGIGNPFYGKKHKEKTKILMKKKAKERIDNGLNKTLIKRGSHISSNTEFKKGMKHTEEFKIYISKKLSGKNHYNWKGGISFEPYSIDWTETLKRAIRERDNYICQSCNQYGNIVHHIDYNKKNCNPNNLVTLCSICHTKTNFNRKHWYFYFKKLMEDKNGS